MELKDCFLQALQRYRSATCGWGGPAGIISRDFGLAVALEGFGA